MIQTEFDLEITSLVIIFKRVGITGSEVYMWEAEGELTLAIHSRDGEWTEG